MNTMAYREYLAGKQVIIVGPANYLTTSNKGKDIDSFDVVVRLSTGYIIPNKFRAHIGTRTDVLYHQFRPFVSRYMLAYWLASDIEFICSALPIKAEKRQPYIRPFLKYNQGRLKFHSPPDRMYLKFKQRFVGTKLTSGTSAVVDLIQSKLTSLHIVGFDFFRSGEWTDIVSPTQLQVEGNRHRTKGHINLMRYLVKNDRRIRPDKILRSILKE